MNYRNLSGYLVTHLENLPFAHPLYTWKATCKSWYEMLPSMWRLVFHWCLWLSWTFRVSCSFSDIKISAMIYKPSSLNFRIYDHLANTRLWFSLHAQRNSKNKIVGGMPSLLKQLNLKKKQFSNCLLLHLPSYK